MVAVRGRDDVRKGESVRSGVREPAPWPEVCSCRVAIVEKNDGGTEDKTKGSLTRRFIPSEITEPGVSPPCPLQAILVQTKLRLTPGSVVTVY